jgi:hypothetical protein
MVNYPVLSGLSASARIIGWIMLIIAGLMCLTGGGQLATSMKSAVHNPYGTNPFDLYRSISLLAGGASLLIVSLLLIIVGEVIKVFTDIEKNTSQTVKHLAELIRKANMPPALQAQTSPSPSAARTPAVSQEVQGTIDLAKQSGYAVNVRPDRRITFSKNGSETHCYGTDELQRFRRMNLEISIPPRNRHEPAGS